MATILNDPIVEFIRDNEVVLTALYKPNTVKYTEGRGERKSLPQTQGAGRRTNIKTRDITTEISKVSLEVYTTDNNIDFSNRLNQLYDAKATITIQLTESNVSIVFRDTNWTNDPEKSLDTEGTFMLEFEGKRAEQTVNRINTI